MSCSNPMILINTSKMHDPEQRKIVERLKLIHKGSGKSMSTLIIPRELAVQEGLALRECDAVPVPCGSCIGCRLEYSRQWAERMMFESKLHEHNYFLTLTYDDDHLPIGSKGIPTLIDDEISAFMKRLRAAWKDKFNLDGIRFFACGEYGDAGKRPHYHIILFNCPIPDLQERHPIPVNGQIKWIKQFTNGPTGEQLFFSPTIWKCWQEKGSATIGNVTFESCAYVGRYVVKKLKGNESQQYVDCGIRAPYVRMSRRPGIGAEWFTQHLDEIYDLDNFVYKRGDTVVIAKPSRYCDKLLKEKDEQKYYDLKLKRREKFYDSVDGLDEIGVDLKSSLEHVGHDLERRSKMLKRNL